MATVGAVIGVAVLARQISLMPNGLLDLDLQERKNYWAVAFAS